MGWKHDREQQHSGCGNGNWRELIQGVPSKVCGERGSLPRRRPDLALLCTRLRRQVRCANVERTAGRCSEEAVHHSRSTHLRRLVVAAGDLLPVPAPFRLASRIRLLFRCSRTQLAHDLDRVLVFAVVRGEVTNLASPCTDRCKRTLQNVGAKSRFSNYPGNSQLVYTPVAVEKLHPAKLAKMKSRQGAL